MEKEVINNLLKMALPQYRLDCFSTSTGFTTMLYTKNQDNVLGIDMSSSSNPVMYVYNWIITPADMDVLKSMFDMDQIGLYSYEIKGVTNGEGSY